MSAVPAYKRLGEVCEFVRGPFGGSLKKNCFMPEGFAVYEQQHAIYDQFDNIRYFIDEEKFQEMKRFEVLAGDLVMSCSGTMGKVAIVPSNIKRGIINQALLKLSLGKELNVHYLKYWMNSNEFQQSIAKHSLGAAIKNVASVKVLKEIQIPCPLIPEQKQIVSILDEAFEAIDQAKANIEKNIENAKELFQSKLNEIFSQKGDGWEEIKLGSICQKTQNIKWTDYKTEKFEYIDLSSVSRETLKIESTSLVNEKNAPSRAKKLVQNGDVIFATTRPTLKRATIIGKKYDGQICSTGYVVLRPDSEAVKSEWIYFYLQSSFFMDRMESLQRGASYPAVTDSDVKGCKVMLPLNLNKQIELIGDLAKIQDHTNELISSYSMKLTVLSDLKKSFLQKAFSGELTMSETELSELKDEQNLSKRNDKNSKIL